MAQQVMEKNRQERDQAVQFFQENIKPKLEQKMEEIAKQLRWTLQIAAGESTDQILNQNDDDQTDISQEPVHQQVMKMKS
jgi:hypothetical protein